VPPQNTRIPVTAFRTMCCLIDRLWQQLLSLLSLESPSSATAVVRADILSQASESAERASAHHAAFVPNSDDHIISSTVRRSIGIRTFDPEKTLHVHIFPSQQSADTFDLPGSFIYAPSLAHVSTAKRCASVAVVATGSACRSLQFDAPACWRPLYVRKHGITTAVLSTTSTADRCLRLQMRGDGPDGNPRRHRQKRAPHRSQNGGGPGRSASLPHRKRILEGFLREAHRAAPQSKARSVKR
jgi:hypothetical protein